MLLFPKIYQCPERWNLEYLKDSWKGSLHLITLTSILVNQGQSATHLQMNYYRFSSISPQNLLCCCHCYCPSELSSSSIKKLLDEVTMKADKTGNQAATGAALGARSTVAVVDRRERAGFLPTGNRFSSSFTILSSIPPSILKNWIWITLLLWFYTYIGTAADTANKGVKGAEVTFDDLKVRFG